MSKEIEMKVKLKSPTNLRKKLKEVGAKYLGKEKQVNITFDSPYFRNVESGNFLRLRKTEKNTILTYKGKDEPNTTAKIREEIEVKVNNFDNMLSILTLLGFVVKFRYEKNREIYHFEGTEIVIDEFPKLGWFCEIEARSESDIMKIAEKLSINPKELTNKSYWYFMDEYMKKTNQTLKEFVF
jgi:adenylate cyclase class 2